MMADQPPPDLCTAPGQVLTVQPTRIVVEGAGQAQGLLHQIVHELVNGRTVTFAAPVVFRPSEWDLRARELSRQYSREWEARWQAREARRAAWRQIPWWKRLFIPRPVAW